MDLGLRGVHVIITGSRHEFLHHRIQGLMQPYRKVPLEA